MISVLVVLILMVKCTNAGETFNVSQPIGGADGSFWSDEDVFLNNAQITAIAITSGDAINGIRVKYGDKWGQWHGGTGGDVNTFDIDDIISIKGNEFKGNHTTFGRVLSIEFTTGDGTRFGPYGHSKAKDYEKHISGCHLAFLSGYTGAVDWLLRVTGITFHWICGKTELNPKIPIQDTPIIGSKIGSFWNDNNEFRNNGPIKRIETRSGKTINGFRVMYGRRWGKWHGGTGGELNSFPIENINCVRGYEFQGNQSTYGHVISIEFTSSNGTRFGPIGQTPIQGKKYKRCLNGCYLAYMSGYNRAVDWLLKVTGIVFHWAC